MKNDTKKSADYYMSLPYTFDLIPEPGGGWFVAVKELPGCMSEGETPQDTMLMIRDAMRGWIEVALEDGDQIPEPRAPSSSRKVI
jgi:antitoxin HicB